MKIGIAIVSLLFVLAFCGAPAKADACSSPGNLVANCGFETGDFTGWTLSGNDVPSELGNLYGLEGSDPFPLPAGTDPNSGSFQAFFADQYADATTLSQSLATSIGQTYSFSFYMAQELVGPGSVNNVFEVSLGGTDVEDLTDVAAQGYTLYSGTFTATSASTALDFKAGNDIGEFLLDDVSVTSSPEPSALLLGGPLAALLALVLMTFRKQRIAPGY